MNDDSTTTRQALGAATQTTTPADGPKEPPDRPAVRATIEALVLASDEPLSRAHIARSLADVAPDAINRAIETLKLDFSGEHRGVHLVEIAGGLQFRTNPDLADRIRQMYASRPTSLSRAAMETLAIVAYQQPLTRAQVEQIRGVDCSGVLRTLQDHSLIETVGRLDDIGRPHIWGTTERFLEFFGLETLADLPVLDQDELESLDNFYQDELSRPASDP